MRGLSTAADYRADRAQPQVGLIESDMKKGAPSQGRPIFHPEGLAEFSRP